MKQVYKKIIPAFLQRWRYNLKLIHGFTPAVGRVRLGDLNRVSPISTQFGYDRGGPIDRYYIEHFLRGQAERIRGHVLEIGDNYYTLQVGGSRVVKSDVLHIHAENPLATLVGDLSNAPHLPDSTFDCIILTQTLQMIYDFHGAIATCNRILKPGGTLLITAPGISQIGQDEWKDTWLWSFTTMSLHRLLQEQFPADTVDVRSYGNVLTASSFLFGLGVSELSRPQLDSSDPYYQVIVAAKAIKP